jgi:ABC-type sugar transport system ATPase subunit
VLVMKEGRMIRQAQANELSEEDILDLVIS